MPSKGPVSRPSNGVARSVDSAVAGVTLHVELAGAVGTPLVELRWT
jgi:hypothetical protein